MNIEQKATEIAREFRIEELVYSSTIARQAALEMAKWIKEQMILKTCEWLKENKDKYAVYDEEDPFYDGYVRVSDKIIDDLRKTLNEEN